MRGLRFCIFKPCSNWWVCVLKQKRMLCRKYAPDLPVKACFAKAEGAEGECRGCGVDRNF